MAENSGIEWCDHTFNPWIGCTKISPACDFCYAEDWNKRYREGRNWGSSAPRERTKTWGDPVRWNKQAQRLGIRPRVFCASLADVFDNQVPTEWRDDLWKLIRETPNLDWLLLTKRPQNISGMLPPDWGKNGYRNVWLGITVENQREYSIRAADFYSIPSVIHFLSMEPLLGPVELCNSSEWRNAAKFLGRPLNHMLDWVIVGGESGSHYRHTDPDWFRSIRDQCECAGIPCLFKQYGGANQTIIKKLGRELDGIVHNGYPEFDRADEATRLQENTRSEGE